MVYKHYSDIVLIHYLLLYLKIVIIPVVTCLILFRRLTYHLKYIHHYQFYLWMLLQLVFNLYLEPFADSADIIRSRYQIQILWIITPF